MRPTAFYAPDGFGGGRDGDAAVRRHEDASPGRANGVIIGAVLAHERHDDGLVHSHGWAKSEMMVGPLRRATRPDASLDERHDNGLMHGHRWACAAATPAPQPRPSNWGLPLAMLARRAADRHDDGLVHNHDWAMRGQ